MLTEIKQFRIDKETSGIIDRILTKNNTLFTYYVRDLIRKDLKKRIK